MEPQKRHSAKTFQKTNSGLLRTGVSLHRFGGKAIKIERKIAMSTGTILVIILILILVGALPTWPHSKNWGYFPSGGLGLVLIILIILLLMGRI